MKKHIKVTNEVCTSMDTAYYSSEKNGWLPASPEPYPTTIFEWIDHNILGRHFTFGQPYCVVCLRKILLDNKEVN